MHLRRSSFSAVVLSSVLTGFLVVSGCGGGDTGPVAHIVTGKVTKAGEPLGNVDIGFATPGGTEGGGQSGSDGTYEASVPAGTYKIVLSVTEPMVEPPPVSTDPEATLEAIDDADQPGLLSPEDMPFPANWTSYETSPKEVTVNDGENTIDIAIE